MGFQLARVAEVPRSQTSQTRSWGTGLTREPFWWNAISFPLANHLFTFSLNGKMVWHRNPSRDIDHPAVLGTFFHYLTLNPPRCGGDGGQRLLLPPHVPHTQTCHSPQTPHPRLCPSLCAANQARLTCHPVQRLTRGWDAPTHLLSHRGPQAWPGCMVGSGPGGD